MFDPEISVAVAGCGPLTFVDLQERPDHFDDDLLENIAYVRQQAETMTRPDPNTRGVGMSGRWFEVLAGAAERGIAQRRELAAVLQDEHASWQELRAKVLQLVCERDAMATRLAMVREVVGATLQADGRDDVVERAERAALMAGAADAQRIELAEALGIEAGRSWSELLGAVQPSCVIDTINAVKTDESHQRKILMDVAMLLGCTTTAPEIIDAVTRLQEENARLTSEQAGPLAVMRGQSEWAISQLATLVHDVRSAIDEGCGEPWRPGDKRTDRGALLDAVRELVAAWRQARTDAVDATRELYFARQENAELKAEMVRDVDPVAVHEAAQAMAGSNETEPDDVCSECGQETCEQCGWCHECRGPCQRSAAPGRATISPVLAAALTSIATVMATSTRDWSASKGDAWLYGIVIGWGQALEDVAEAMRWPHEVTVQLCALNRAVAEVMTPAVEM